MSKTRGTIFTFKNIFLKSKSERSSISKKRHFKSFTTNSHRKKLTHEKTLRIRTRKIRLHVQKKSGLTSIPPTKIKTNESMIKARFNTPKNLPAHLECMHMPSAIKYLLASERKSRKIKVWSDQKMRKYEWAIWPREMKLPKRTQKNYRIRWNIADTLGNQKKKQSEIEKIKMTSIRFFVFLQK